LDKVASFQEMPDIISKGLTIFSSTLSISVEFPTEARRYYMDEQSSMNVMKALIVR